jgi:hypothetical protein
MKVTLLLFSSCSLETLDLQAFEQHFFWLKQTSGTAIQAKQTNTTKNNTPIT